MLKPATFVFEGPDGVGKTSLINKLVRNLAKEGYAVAGFYSGLSTPAGALARRQDVPTEVQQWLWLADAVWMSNAIAHANLDIALVDRYYLISGFAYHGAWAERGQWPTMPLTGIFLLTAPFAVAQQRLASRTPPETTTAFDHILITRRTQRRSEQVAAWCKAAVHEVSTDRASAEVVADVQQRIVETVGKPQPQCSSDLLVKGIDSR